MPQGGEHIDGDGLKEPVYRSVRESQP